MPPRETLPTRSASELLAFFHAEAASSAQTEASRKGGHKAHAAITRAILAVAQVLRLQLTELRRTRRASERTASALETLASNQTAAFNARVSVVDKEGPRG